MPSLVRYIAAIIFALIFSVNQNVSAQSFTSAANYAAGTHANSVAVGDFNNDGKSDFAVANSGGSSVSVLINGGSGTFTTPATTYAVGANPISLVAGDFNQDGKLDLAVLNFSDSNVSVLMNSGSGTFTTPAPTYAVGTLPEFITTGDFNSDGKPDLAVAVPGNGGPGNVSILINNGGGGFITPAPAYPIMSHALSLTVGDFNADGKLDIAAPNLGSGTVSILFNNGNGTFTNPAPFVSTTSASPFSITTGDFNGDGKSDLATGNLNTANVSVLINNGSGGFITPAPVYAVGTNPQSITVGDFNLDGKTDLAVANSGGTSLSILINTGTGTFITPAPTFTVGDNPYSVAVADFNTDGKPDFVTANYGSNDASVLINTAIVQAGFFGTPVNKSVAFDSTSVAAGDFNADGKPDLAVTGHVSRNLSVLINNGDGSFANAVNYVVSNSDANRPFKVTVGDLNLDGKPDIVVANSQDGTTLSVFMNNGNGTFAPPVNYTVGNYPRTVVVADFNGDGKPDLAVPNSLDGNVSVLFNNGAGTFAAPVNYSVGVNPDGATVGDFNGDGKPDIATENVSNNNVSILINNGSGAFITPAPTYTVGTTPTSVAVGDFNLDGKLDLVTTNRFGNNVSVLINNGNGTFASQATYATYSDPISVAVGDFNRDGKPDLATANNANQDLSILINNGNGTFAAPINRDTQNFTLSIVVADFNVDGRPDLALANQNDAVSELINRASAPTSAPSSISGQINTPSGAPLAGAVITLSGARSVTTITDGSGQYRFDNLETGAFYVITPSFANHTFSPANRAFTLTGNVTDATFTATPDAIPTANPMDTSEYFVRQQYLDFLDREPDAGGFGYWSSQFTACRGDAQCLRQTRINVSAAFFIEAEFQQTGSFIYRIYKAGLGKRLSYGEFSADRAQIIAGPQLDQQRAAFVRAFVERAEFQERYKSAQTAEAFVDSLIASVWNASAVDLGAERSILIAQYQVGTSVNESRAIVLHSVAEDGQLKMAEYNPSFVLMQYYGYLRRDVDEGGFQFWLNVLNKREPNNFLGMVCSFITSAEYQKRFSSIITHSNQECSQ